jgi:Zn-dependent M28 family amino/carboxypeptidase
MPKLVWRIFVAALVSSLSVAAAAQQKRAKALPAITGIPAGAANAMAGIDPERIRVHVRFLANDLLEGRGTGQRGGDIAAEYIATQFALSGLQPAGDNGSYFQKVPMVGITTVPEQTTFALVPASGPAMDLKYKDDYVANDETQGNSADIDAPIVFVGYGIEAPEYNWDDYKGLDVKGKVLLMFVNEPPSNDPNFFKGKALTYYGRWTYKYEQAARKGAVGALLIHREDLASYGWDVVRNSNSGEKSYLRDDSAPKLKTASWIQWEIARRLLASSGQDLDRLLQAAGSRDFKPIPLNSNLRAHIVSKVRPFESNNVVGLLPGSDPALKNQAVVYSAHYDHLGIRPEQPGDKIYNGAADNATGCGILLELAHAFGTSQTRTKRSILFASVTAEEQGLLGSKYLGLHPPVKAGSLTLGLNFDDVPPIGDPEEVEVSGAERTSFYPTVEQVAGAFGLQIKPDSRPEAGHYYRSDHFSMARVGVPSFSVNEGMKYAGHPLGWGEQQAKDYVEHRYHQPTDEYQPSMDFTGDAKIARFGFALGWNAANLPNLVQWQAGDEFEAVRKKSMQGQ